MKPACDRQVHQNKLFPGQPKAARKIINGNDNPFKEIE